MRYTSQKLDDCVGHLREDGLPAERLKWAARVFSELSADHFPKGKLKNDYHELCRRLLPKGNIPDSIASMSPLAMKDAEERFYSLAFAVRKVADETPER